MTPLSQDEAREALAQIDQVAREMRRAVGSSLMGFNLMLWGVIWMLAFTLSFVYPSRADQVWSVLSTVGLLVSGASAFFHSHRPVVVCEQSRKLGLQILWFWLAVLSYVLILGFIIRFRSPADRLLFYVSIFMLAYVVKGIWLKSPILCLIGLVVTIAAVAGRIWLTPHAFLLWMAFFGGGGLFFPGLYVQLRWK